MEERHETYAGTKIILLLLVICGIFVFKLLYGPFMGKFIVTDFITGCHNKN